MPGVQVRHAALTDLDALCALEQVAFEQQDQFSRRAIRYLLKSHNLILVAASDKQVLGQVTVLFRATSSRGRIYSLAVDPDARGRGIAHSLLRAAEGEARARDGTRLGLEVRSTNMRAQKIYSLAGYEVLGVKRDYYPDGEAAVIMEKKLLSPQAK